jgi:galactose oxidase
MWSSNGQFTYEGDIGTDPSQTYTLMFNPSTGSSSVRVVTNTLSDMFCPGTVSLPDGRILVNGGSSSSNTSIYDPGNNTWSDSGQLNIARGYNADVLLSTGDVLTLGGSWAGDFEDKIGEVWSSATGWAMLTGVSAVPITGPDPEDVDGVFRGDNHPWLFQIGGGWVFQAGPSAEMNWIDTAGNAIYDAGPRGDDQYSMNGQAVMYDIYTILKTGGAPGYEYTDATAATYVIDLNQSVIDGSPPVVRNTAPMAYPRAYANGVVLPNGQVLIVGGATQPVTFSDDTAVLVPELWDPVSETFTQLNPMQTPRTYHSVALLLPDARVLVGGGGLCGSCPTNHPDVEIFSPPYLYNSNGTQASRPSITSAPSAAQAGQTISVKTNVAVTNFAIVHMSSVTHSVNNDQRRVPLQIASHSGTSYMLSVPSDTGVISPGYYMLFAINAKGTPSVARIIQFR